MTKTKNSFQLTWTPLQWAWGISDEFAELGFRIICAGPLTILCSWPMASAGLQPAE